MCVLSRFCSKQRQTARQQPVEARITYPFHPRCGEIVLIQRRYAYRGIDVVVIPQPDGSVACLPADRVGGRSDGATVVDGERLDYLGECLFFDHC